MKAFREWISCQLVSKSLLSARPLSFSEEESTDGNLNDDGTAVAPTIQEAVSADSSANQVNEVPSHLQVISAEVSHLSHLSDKNNKDSLAKVDALQIKFLRLVHRLGLSPENLVVAQVLYRLQLASLIRAGESHIKRASLKIDKARDIAAELEAAVQTDLDFSFKILVLGKTGVGKSATINSIFGQTKAETDAFHPATDRVQEIVGTIKGIKITVIDTPGLSPFYRNQRRNRKIMLSVKRFIRKSPPDIVLYFERLDAINMGYSDFPLLKLITDVLGSSVWFNTILVMTHSSSATPEGPAGYPVSYEAFVNQCTNLVQYYIHQAVSDTRLENPILLVENHPLCRTNMEGEKVLPNGLVWRSQFLLLCISTKVLADANNLLKFRDSLQIGSTGTRLPSLPHLLSSILKPRSMPSSSVSDDDMGELLDVGDEDEYDQLPPICILTKAQYQRLTKAQKNDYLDELDYRETLYLKKQLKEELRRRRESMCSKDEFSENNENDDPSVSPEAVPLPDMAIPQSFDSDSPGYRYRNVISDDRLLVRPVLDSQGWDHDVGFDGINLETSMEIKRNLHATVVGQMSKDKLDFNVQTECMARYMDPEGHTFCAGVDVQTTGRDIVCTIQGDMKFRNLGCNMTGGGISLTSFGNMYFTGAKFEDSVSIAKMVKLGLNAGCIRGHGRAANGGSLELTIRGKNYPVRDEKLTLAMTLLSSQKEMVLGGSIQSDFRAGRGTKMSLNANLNSRTLGQVSIRTSTSDHVEIALIAVFSMLRALLRRRVVNDPQH